MMSQSLARLEVPMPLLASVDEPAEVSLHPSMAQAYASLAERLHAALESEEGERVRTELRALIERVDFHPLEGLREVRASGPWKAKGPARG